MEDFEQKYNELVEAARAVVEANPGLSKIDKELGRLSKLLPEKESEDERIRKMLVEQMERWKKCAEDNNVEQDVKDASAALAYLEKQKEQKPVKFNDDTEVGLDRALQIVKHAKGNLRGYQSDDGIYECDHAIETLERILKDGIEQKSAELPKSEDYGIDGLYAAIDILQKTLGEVDGYQTDDGILEHKCAISAVKELYEQKPAEWSEEDLNMIGSIRSTIAIDIQRDGKFPEIKEAHKKELKWFDDLYQRNISVQKQEWSDEDEQYLLVCKNALSKYQRSDHWDANLISEWLENRLKSISLQSKVEWSEGDEGMLKCIIATLCEESHGGREANDKMVTWLENRLKSLRPQPHWKPSKEQINALKVVARGFPADDPGAIDSLLSDLEKQITAI